MTHIDQLRTALRESPTEGFDAADIERIMFRGRRLRRRRIAVRGAGALTAAAAVTAVVLGASELRADRGSSDIGQGGPPTISIAPETERLGDLVRTGIRDENGELVFRAVPVDEGDLPGVTFGLTAGRERAPGQVSSDYTTNETEGSATSPGFHGVSSSAVVAGTPYPAFGYYAGPAHRIVGVVGGRPVRAHQAPLPGVPDVVVFWFDYRPENPDELAAYDVDGKRLPEGNTSVGVG